ncbi:MAG: lipase family protein, partial [Bdellovibrionales bacterium]
QLNAKLDAKLFIAGYSQGGHAAMALLKFLEEDSTHEFTVTAAAPMAGPYALAETMEKILTAPSPHSTAESMYMIVGLNPLYSMYKDLNEAVRPEYVETVSTLFDGTHDWADVLSKLSMPLQDLLKPDYLQAAVTDPNSPLIKALVANQVYKWTPKTPIHLYHGGGDHEVPFANSQKAYDYMISQGANIELINLGDLVDHLPGFNLAIGQAAVWFEGFRQVSH